MSGIGGVWNLDGCPADARFIESMMSAIAHRGPHGKGTWVAGPVALGHQKLAVTPEAACETQPLVMGSSVIVFDGRLDNRADLIALLQPDNTSCGDSELALLAYRRWGEDMPAHLVGDFAFALWDGQKEQWLCARDHIGIKIIHYYFDGRTFMVGSEIKQILHSPKVSRSLDMSQLGMFLSLREGEADQTFYTSVKRIPAGHLLIVRRSGITSRAYWTPGLTRRCRLASQKDYVERFRELFQEAVRCRLRSAGPVGFMVSGGLDSTSTFATARQIARGEEGGGDDFHTFSWVFPNMPEIDETSNIRRVIGDASSSNHFINGEDYWGMKPSSGNPLTYDEPYVAPYEALLNATFQGGKDAGIRVMLTGQGGEVTTEGVEYLLDLLVGLRWLEFRKALGVLPPRARLAAYRRCVGHLVPDAVAQRVSGKRVEAFPPWLASEFVEATRLESQMREPKDQKVGFKNRRARSMYKAIKMTGRSPWTVWADHASAQYGLEVRHPFWDVRIIEFLTAMSPGENFDVRWTKFLLRRAMEGTLPREVCWQRAKTSLGPLFDFGATQKEHHRLKVMSEDMRLAQISVVDQSSFEQEFRRYRNGDQTYRDFFWATFVAEEWLRQLPNVTRKTVAPQLEESGVI